MSTSHVLGRLEDFVPNKVNVVRLRGERRSVVNSAGHYYCFADR